MEAYPTSQLLQITSSRDTGVPDNFRNTPSAYTAPATVVEPAGDGGMARKNIFQFSAENPDPAVLKFPAPAKSLIASTNEKGGGTVPGTATHPNGDIPNVSPKPAHGCHSKR